MEAIIITIGDELLIGQTIDTNAAWLASELNSIGISLCCKYTIPDKVDSIDYYIRKSMREVSLVIVTGGLGPTKDDITKAVLCDVFDSKLKIHQTSLDNIIEFLRVRNIKMNDNNYNQAFVPDNCLPLENKIGTAPGMWFEDNASILIALPGVPFEMKALVSNEVLPRLQKQYDLPIVRHRTIIISGLPESHLAETLSEWEESLPKYIQIAYLPSPGIIRLRLSVYKSDDNKDAEIEKYANKLLEIIPNNIVSMQGAYPEELLASLLRSKSLTLATAESCTGGAIASLLTKRSGASDYFLGSVVAYHNQIKQNVLGVNAETLEKKGAVSREVVEEMAVGVLNLFNSDFAIAVTGIAGPTGGTTEKPVGTVWIGLATKDNVKSQLLHFGNMRDVNINRTVYAALLFLLQQLKKDN